MQKDFLGDNEIFEYALNAWYGVHIFLHGKHFYTELF